MPLRWKRGENPYRLNYFAILGVGAHANPRRIANCRDDLKRKIRGGVKHRVEGRSFSETDLDDAGSRLLDPVFWTSEVLLVHPPPATDEGRLPGLRDAVNEATAPGPPARPLPLADLAALAPLIPGLHVADLPRPSWTELPVPDPDSPRDLDSDIQFDL